MIRVLLWLPAWQRQVSSPHAATCRQQWFVTPPEKQAIELVNTKPDRINYTGQCAEFKIVVIIRISSADIFTIPLGKLQTNQT